MSDLTVTSYALLGQLALRSWDVYDMTKNIGRTLHWFWPRAESSIYAEMKRLKDAGFARTTTSPGARGRDRTTYHITAAGTRALRRWLATEPGPSTLHAEAILRVHLSPWGGKPDLERAIAFAKDEAEGLIRQAVTIGMEFAERRHRFQEQVHIRAILFDYLWNHGLTTYLWAERSLAEIARWDDLAPTRSKHERAVAAIARGLRHLPRSIAIVDDPEASG